MATTIIIVFCCLLLLGYLFDLSFPKTKVPSVLLLLALGWGVRQLADLAEVEIPGIDFVLPVLGTIGLILIVLEGALELQLSRSKRKIMTKSLIMSVGPLFIVAFSIGFAFNYFGGYSLKTSLINIIPLCVISSAIAIPTVRYMRSDVREIVTYESSLSDIIGVIFFNFVALRENISGVTFLEFLLEVLIILVASLVATVGLSFILSKNQHHVKYVPILLFVILIYSLSKFFHLPALVFIMMFGLLIGNFNKFTRFPWFTIFGPETMKTEVSKFKDMVAEFTFVIKSLFFLIFGFLIDTAELLNPDSFFWAAGIVLFIYIIRFYFLQLLRLPTKPLLFIAPRGLITILLFIAIPEGKNLYIVNKSLVIQVIVLSSLLMMFGMWNRDKEKNTGHDKNDSAHLPDKDMA